MGRPVILSFGLGCLILVAILTRYVHGRIALISWNVKYGERSQGTDLNNTNALGSQVGGQRLRQPRMRSIYDRWLVLRFAIAFIALGYGPCSPSRSPLVMTNPPPQSL